MKRTLLVLSMLAACGRPAPESPPVEQPQPPSTAPDLSGGMLKHWVLVTEIRDAVIGGNLENVWAAAAKLSTAEAPTVPVGWAPHVQQMKVYAKAAEVSDSLASAAIATANLGATCGQCHASTGAGLEMPTGQAPAEGDDPRAHMRRHSWAANAMWAGLVTPSEGRWQDGAGVLAEKPMHETEQASEFVVTEEVTQLGERVHDLGVQAAGATTLDQRAAVYAELLGTCAACHGLTQQGPR